MTEEMIVIAVLDIAILVTTVACFRACSERNRYMFRCKELERQLEDQKQEMIDKACAYLKENRNEVNSDDPCLCGYIPDEFIDDFRESMNEQIKIEL